jgi:hypothetical protein
MQSRLIYDRFKKYWNSGACFCCYLHDKSLKDRKFGVQKLLSTVFLIEKDAPDWCPYILEHTLCPETIDLKNVSLSDIQ